MLTHISLEQRIRAGKLRRLLHMVAVVFGIVAIAGLVIFRVHSATSSQRAGAAPVPLTRAEAALQRRLGLSASVDIGPGMRERSALLARSVEVRFVRRDGTEIGHRSFALREQPSWIAFSEQQGMLRAAVSADRVAAALRAAPPFAVRTSASCALLSTWKDAYGVERAQTSCVGRAGDIFDPEHAASSIVDALHAGRPSVDVVVEQEQPSIDAVVDGTPLRLSMLATGRSMFKGSGLGRKANVRKAIGEHVHNVWVPKGETLSFATLIGGPVSVSNGWQMALTIFEGQNLRPAPGGGMCQASTTLYRAALRAGLPIVEQRNHSLYVSYYEQYGVGLDATVFPGHQDLKVRNDTPGPLLVQAYTEGDDAYVSIYGVADGRAVTIDGPYFASTTPESFSSRGRSLRAGEVGWVRTMTHNDGTTSTELIVSRYQKFLPRTIASRIHASSETMIAGGETTALHAAATVPVAME